MVTLVTGFLMVILFAVFGFVLFVLFYDSPNKLCYSKCSNSSSDGNLKLFGGDVPDEVFITITGIVTLISWIIAILLCHLLAFHIYFSEFIMYCLYSLNVPIHALLVYILLLPLPM